MKSETPTSEIHGTPTSEIHGTPDISTVGVEFSTSHKPSGATLRAVALVLWIFLLAALAAACGAIKTGTPDPVWTRISEIPTRIYIRPDPMHSRMTVDSVPMLIALPMSPTQVGVSINPAWVAAPFESHTERCGDRVRIIIETRTIPDDKAPKDL